MTLIQHNTGIAAMIGKYSDAVEVVSPQRWLHTAGTPGMLANGQLPEGIEAQTRQAWANVAAALAKAGMGYEHMVKVTTTLTNAEDIPAYARIRSEILGDLRPSFMLQVVNLLISPEMRVEVEIIAAK